MKKYIIQMLIKVNGEWNVYFHEDIIKNENKQFTNIYAQSVTSKKRLAKIFYDEQEAHKVASFFSNDCIYPKIIQK